MNFSKLLIKIPEEDKRPFIVEQFIRNIKALKIMGAMIHTVGFLMLIVITLDGQANENNRYLSEKIFLLSTLLVGLILWFMVLKVSKNYTKEMKPKQWLTYLYSLTLMLWASGYGVFGLLNMRGILPYFSLLYVTAIVIDFSSKEFIMVTLPAQLAFSLGVFLLNRFQLIRPGGDLLLETFVFFFVAIFLNYYINELHKKNYLQRIQLEKSNDKLTFLSFYDPLSDLHNRRRWEDVYHRMFNEAIEKKRSLGVVIIDIDYFKQYNDNYGHVAGDEVIRQVSRVLKQAVSGRESNVGRYGGDEFAMSCTNVSESDLEVMVDKLKKDIYALDIIHEYSKIGNKLTLSVGAYICLPDEGLHPWAPVIAADKRLYKEKENRMIKMNQ